MRSASTRDINKSIGTDPFSIYSSGNGPLYGGYVDQWNRQPEPHEWQLIRCYEATVKACLDRIASAVTQSTLRLFVKTLPGQKRHKSVVYSAPVCPIKRKFLYNKDPHAKAAMNSVIDVEEVFEHESLRALRRPNDVHDYTQLMRYTIAYRGILGGAFWEIDDSNQLILIPTQLVKPHKNKTGRVDYYDIGTPGLAGFRQIDAKNVIAFPCENLRDPYYPVGVGYLRACYQQVLLQRQTTATLGALMQNGGNSRIIVGLKGQPGRVGMERAIESFAGQMTRANDGRPVFVGDDITVSTLSIPPKDMAAAVIAGLTKEQICESCGVHNALLAGAGEITKATLDAARLDFSENTLAPLLTFIAEQLNTSFLPRFSGEDDDRLFFAFDDPSPASQEAMQTYLTAAGGGAWMEVNEVRKIDGLPAKPGYDYIRSQPGEKAGLEGDQPKSPPPDDENAKAIKALAEQVKELNWMVRSLPIGSAKPPRKSRRDNHQGRDTDVAQGKDAQPLTRLHAVLDELGIDRKAQSDTYDNGSVDEKYIDQLAEIVERFAERQKTFVLGHLTKRRKNDKLPRKFRLDGSWDEELADEASPVIQIILTDAAKKLLRHFDQPDEAFRVVNPHVTEAVKSIAFKFAQSTNETTSKQLNEALAELQTSLDTGLTAGERLPQLTKRVQEIFESLSKERAKLIGRTESQRAYNKGTAMSAKASGVVSHFELILSPTACEKCIAIKAERPRIELDGEIPPYHPNCYCSILSVLNPAA